MRSITGVRVLALACVIGCTPPPSAPHAPEPRPTLVSAADMYNSRIVALRTTLGRAAIELETRGVDRTVATPSCGDGPAGGACVRCELATDSRAVDGSTLEAITAAFARYPSDALGAAHVASVALCRHIDFDSPDTAGIADYAASRMLISLEPFIGPSYDSLGPFTVEDIVHHEYFHLLEAATMQDVVAADPEWDLYNPLGFAYGKIARTAHRPDGFVDAYAATSRVEDRASVFQYVMARPDELCELARTDDTVRTKARMIWQRVAAVTGEAFLRARAPCVDWIDAGS
jgi:hypothetical protein